MKVTALLILLLGVLAFGWSCSAGEHQAAASPGDAAETFDDPDPSVRQALKLVEKIPDSPNGYVQLAAAYIRLARETGSAEYSTKAEAAVARASEIDPSSAEVRKLKATLLLNGHHFAEALDLGKQLAAELPNDAFVWGILTDANAELGNYDEAVRSAQRMVDIRPNAASYARVGHIRSLHGDTAGAIEAFRLAARMSDPADSESRSWAVVQIGNEYWRTGRYGDAVRSYDEALEIFPDYYLALAGKGRALASLGEFAAAAEHLERAAAKHVNIDNIFLLGDVYTRLGETAKANAQYALAQSGEAGLGRADDPHRVALFWANNGIRLDEAVAIAEQDRAKQSDIYASDTLAWCLYKAGRLDEAKRHADEAMRLGTPDAKILFHAGMIAKARGERREAVGLLSRAIKLNPQFDPLLAGVAASALGELKKGIR
ncbi:MAG: tetratricopeptide repeat protein [Pyrinomonadaceae bacterium]